MTDDELCALYEHGLTLREIEEQTDINRSTVRRRVLRAGGEMRPRGSPASGRRKKIVEMSKAGLSCAEIGRQLGVSRQRVSFVLRQARPLT